MRREKKTKIKLKLININIYMLYHLSRSWMNQLLSKEEKRETKKKWPFVWLIEKIRKNSGDAFYSE